jgi:opacity protein-like surface antigen
MKKFLALAGVCALLASPAFAQDKKPDAAGGAAEPAAEAPTKEEATKAAATIDAMADDAKKAAGYCALSKEMAGIPDGDDKKAEEVGKKLDDYLVSISQDTAEAFGIAEAVDPETEEGKKVDAAFAKLESKCGA